MILSWVTVQADNAQSKQGQENAKRAFEHDTSDEELLACSHDLEKRSKQESTSSDTADSRARQRAIVIGQEQLGNDHAACMRS